MASGEMRCTWCKAEIRKMNGMWQGFQEGEGGEGHRWTSDCYYNGSPSMFHEPAAVPESAIEPEPQRDDAQFCPICDHPIVDHVMDDVGPDWFCDINGCECTFRPAASSAIEVAPPEKSQYRVIPVEWHRVFVGNEPSVAPGEAQREPTPLQSSGGTKCSDCGHDEAVHEDGCTVSWRETSPAGFRKNYQCPCEKFVPAVPSEVAPSREQRLEDALRNLHTAVWKNCGKVRLLRMIEEIEEAKAALEAK